MTTTPNDPGEQENDAADADSDAARREETRRSLKTKFKIVLGVYQIINAIPWTIPTVSFPKAFEALIGWTSFLELNIIQILPISCLQPSFNFYGKLLVVTLFPIGLTIMIFVIAKLSVLSHAPDRAHGIWNHSFGWFLLLTFIVFPSVSTTVLRHYNCISFDVGQSDGSTKTEKILESAYDISCESPSYGAWTAYASSMLFVYPIGIPFLYWVLLFRYRKHINPDVGKNPLSEIEGSSDERPRSPSAEAYMELSQRISLSRQDSSARNLMTELLGHSEVSTEEIQERKLLTRNADPPSATCFSCLRNMNRGATSLWCSSASVS